MYSNYNNNYATPQNASVAIRLADLEDLQQGYPSQFVEQVDQTRRCLRIHLQLL